MIAIVFGLPGSGKSFFAKQFAAHINAEHVSSDKLRKEMLKAITYSDNEKQSVYNEMLKRIKDLMKHNKNAVVDATFNREKFRKQFMHEVPESIFIEVKADETVVKKRLQRKRTDSEADFEVYKKIKDDWEPMLEDHLILQSTDNNIEGMLRQASKCILLNDDK